MSERKPLTKADLLAFQKHLKNLNVPDDIKKQWESVDVIINDNKVEDIIPLHYGIPKK